MLPTSDGKAFGEPRGSHEGERADGRSATVAAMSDAPSPAADRPTRWGLTAKLFAALLLLGGLAVLATSTMGYIQARDALEQAIYHQLTVARETKARQVEGYFRTVRQELLLLAHSKMVVEAARGFRAGADELDQDPAADTLRPKVEAWYEAHFMPDVRRLLGKDVPVAEYLPIIRSAFYLQYHYIVTNPNPPERRLLLDDPGDGSTYSREHAIHHPLLRAAAATVGFEDFLIADAKTGNVTYGMAKEVEFGTSLKRGPYRTANIAVAVSRCAGMADRSATCLEDFAAYMPAAGEPTAFMAAPIIDQGTVIAVLVAQLSIEAIDRVVTGNRRWRQEGFGITGEANVVGPDFLLRSGGRLFHEHRDRYFAELEAAGDPPQEIAAIKRYGSPVLHQRLETQATRAALAGAEGTGRVIGNFGKATLASWGPLEIAGVRWGLVAKIETDEAFAPIRRLERDLAIVGAFTLVAVIGLGGWLSRSLTGPLRDLTAGARRFAAGDANVHVAARSRDEIGQLCLAFNGMVDDISAKNALIETKNAENEALLLNVLPAPIANRLRGGEQRIADGFANVSVLFADLVGFTQLSTTMPPQDLVALLNGLFSRFDQAAQELGIEKIKTVGDAYMAVCGMPQVVDDHSERMVRMAIRMVHITREHAIEHRAAMQVRVGINSGPVVAGVIGRSKYIYDLWGDTVNLASRMESTGVPGAIQVTRPVYEELKDKFVFEPRGAIEVKGKGQVEAWLLNL
jgi:class 3 adenylate cyclase